MSIKMLVYFKMYRIFAILVLVASVHSQSVEDLINKIFTPKPIVSTTTTSTTSTTTTTSTVKPVINEIKPTTFVPPPNTNDASCVLDGMVGVCVPHYLCDSNNITKTDGGDMLDLRGGGSCVSYMDVCCFPPDHRPPTNPITPKPDLLKPQREGCGWANPEGVGMRTTGETDGETKFGEFPWMVAIMKFQPEQENDPNGPKPIIYFGGGSLIHQSIVLTAAHIVANKPELSVRAGEWDTRTTKEIYPHQDREVESIAVHKDFNAGILFYDVALLFLKRPMDMAPNVGLACLPLHGEMAYTNTRCFASGWGKDKFEKKNEYQVILKKVEVPVVDNRMCETRLRTTKLKNLFQLHSSFMCAGGEPGKDTCKGDGGSPLVCPIEYEKDRYMQYGIVSWGIGCGDTGIPGVYVDVSKVRNWIDDKVRGKRYSSDAYTYY